MTLLSYLPEYFKHKSEKAHTIQYSRLTFPLFFRVINLKMSSELLYSSCNLVFTSHNTFFEMKTEILSESARWTNFGKTGFFGVFLKKKPQFCL